MDKPEEGTPLQFAANQNVFEHLARLQWGVAYTSDDYSEAWHLERVERAVQELLDALFIDTENDHNTKETAKRVAKMYVKELMRGRYEPMPDVTSFPNVGRLNELYVVGPIAVRSMCSHHLMPVYGRAWVGVIPSDDKVIGLSKFSRLLRWVFARPQIQEEAAMQFADLLEQTISPKGLGIVVKATHMCMTMRGVFENEDATMTTNVMRGALLDKPEARAEFLSIVGLK